MDPETFVIKPALILLITNLVTVIIATISKSTTMILNDILASPLTEDYEYKADNGPIHNRNNCR